MMGATRIVLIFVRLSLVDEAAPDPTPNVEDRQLVIFPPQTPNFPLPANLQGLPRR
jgi:hypothetical protein